MPAFNLAPVLDRAIRVATDSFWALWRHDPDRADVSAPLQRPSQVNRRSHGQHMRSTGATTPAGAQTFDIIHDIYTCEQATTSLETRLEECERMVQSVQKAEDIATLEIARLGPVLRANHPEFAAAIEKRRDNALAAKPEFLAQRSSLKEELSQQKQRAARGWLDFCKHAQNYFNQCLAVDFSEPWSISEQKCQALRHVLDVLDLNEKSRSKLRKLSYKQIKIRCTQWKVEKDIREAPASVLPVALDRKLDLIRAARFADEFNIIQAEMSTLQREIADRDELLLPLIHWAVVELMEPQIQSFRQWKAEGEGVSELSEDSRGPGEDTDAQNSTDARSTSHGSGSIDLFEEFEDARLDLERRQRNIALNRWHHESDANAVRHLLTFSDSTPAIFAARQAKRLQEQDEILRKAEDAFEIARSNLLASGAEIPPSTSREQKKPKGGGRGRDARSSDSKVRGSIVSHDSFKIRRLNRRPLNEWRRRTQDVVSESAVTKRSSCKLSGLGSGRSRSPTASPESYRQRKLEEYVTEQERLREEAARG